MTFEEIKQGEETYIMHTYGRFPIALDHGKGATLWDTDGKKYIDLTSGIGVNSLGHDNEALTTAVSEQAHKLMHACNLYYTEPMVQVAKKLVDAAGMGKIFFENSGAEANEAALKLARKFAHDRYGSHKSGIVAFKNAFHGRTLFTVSAGGQPAYSQDFAPLPADIRHAAYNDINSASALIDDSTCAVIVEPIQGEGGVVPASNAFLQGLRELCNRHNALLIFDEVQTGVGRTGELYAYMHYGVTPDLLTTAKALGGGFPVGALLATEECARVMTVGTHGTTYGGNPLASAVAGKVLELINTPEMLNGVKQRHDWFVERLNTINHRYGLFSEVRGLGLLIGCVLNADYAGQAKQISQEAAKAGVMVLIAGGNVVRFAPALNVSEEEVTTGQDRFAAACEHFVSRGSS